MGPLIIAALLGLACAMLVLQPLFGLDRAGRDADERPPVALAEVAERERLAKQALLEVDFDHRLGNLGDADYAALRARYERRALAALKARFERERTLDEEIERQLDALRKQNTQGKAAGRSKRSTRATGAETPQNASPDSNAAPTAEASTTDRAPALMRSAGPNAGVKANGRTAASSLATSTTILHDRSPRRRKGV